MTHRFYTGKITTKEGLLELREETWIQDSSLVNQVLRVLRMRVGEELVLFDGNGTERLYSIDVIEDKAFHVKRVTDLVPTYPHRKVVLAWSLLKKDKNDWVIQKATELGVTRLLPLITERTEKTGFDVDRAHKIAIEAAEQCGRHSLVDIHEPQTIPSVIGQYSDKVPLCVADMSGGVFEDNASDEVVVFVGPEGGWTDKERTLFSDSLVPTIRIGAFTLRAETASIAAVQLLMS